MAQDNDEIAEARRKALRNGEEDPVVIAQRYLNIYRQMHIFPPERKEAFNKMLLELPEDIRNIFGALPGGLMLQDYLSDLMEKQGLGGEAVKTHKNEETSPILDVALSQTAKAQNSNIPQQPQVIQGGNVAVSLGKDFAEQFAGIFDNVMQRQNQMQAESLSKISADLSKGQMSLAQYLTQNNNMQLQAIADLTKVLKESQPAAKVISETNPEINSEVLKQFIANQNEINLRLNKMETTALNNGGVNNEVIEALIKSNEAVMQKMVDTQLQNTGVQNVALSNDNTTHILELIERSQAQLIEGVVQKILQNNQFNSQTQANNNANNIQINTPDTSAQTLMLVNKIADLQASNEKNMEAAIERLIEAQKDIYTKIDNNRGQEIADAIIKGLQSSSLKVNAYIPDGEQIVTASRIQHTETDSKNNEFQENMVADIALEPSAINEPEEVEEEKITEVINEQPKKNKKKKKKKKDKPLLSMQDAYNNWQGEEDESDNHKEDNELNQLFSLPEPEPETTASWNFAEEQKDEEVADPKTDNVADDEEILSTDFTFDDTPPDDEPELVIGGENDNEAITSSSPDVSDNAEEISFDLNSVSGDEWGFGDADSSDSPQEAPFEKNAEETIPTTDEGGIEVIGGDSYIYADDLSASSNYSYDSPVIYDTSYPKIKIEPQIYDDTDEDVDPYTK